MKGFFFVLLVAYGGAAAAVAVPWIGVLTYVFLAALRPYELWPAIGGWNLSDVVAIATIVGWALQSFGDWRLRRATAPVIAIVLLLVWAAVCSVQAVDPRTAWAYVSDLSKIVLPIVLGITLIKTTGQLKQLAWVMVIAYGYVSFVMNEAYFVAGYNRAEMEGFTGGRAAFAIGLVTLLSPALFLAATARATWQRVVAGVCGVLILHTTFLTFSRGGLLGLAVSAAVALWVLPKHPKTLAAAGAVVLVVALLTGPRVWQRFGSTFADAESRDASAESRLELWGNCLVLMRENPVFGVGPDNFPALAVSRFGWSRAGRLSQRKEAHTLWLQTGAEMGVPGLALLLGYYGLVWLWVVPLARGRSSDPDEVALARMVVVGLAGFAVSAQFVSLEGLEPPYYLALIGAGLLKVQGNKLAAGVQDVADTPRPDVTGLPPLEPSPPRGLPAGPAAPARVWRPS
jgi:probable O-glycosylation ligase (exosortase A-associated)